MKKVYDPKITVSAFQKSTNSGSVSIEPSLSGPPKRSIIPDNTKMASRESLQQGTTSNKSLGRAATVSKSVAV